MSIAERLAIAPELRDTRLWHKPREEDIPEGDAGDTYQRRKGAVNAYLNCTPLAKIWEDFRISKSELYRMLDRCLTVRPNGEMFGFFALLPMTSITPYTRTSPIKPELAEVKKGLAGAFMQLMAEHAPLYKYVEKYALDGWNKTAAAVAKAIRPEFLKRCAKLRGPNEYPFNTNDYGARALVRFIERIREDHFVATPTTKKGEEFRTAGPLTAQPSGAQRLRPFEEIEHDGHKGDFYFVLKIRGLHGEWVYTAPMRMWLLLLIDRASRALLGYAYRLGSTNYPAIAVMRSFVHAFTRWKPKEITLPDLAYKEGAGFPSGLVPTAYGRLIDLVCFDNAKANTAKVTLRKLTTVIGATLNYGRANYPIARPFVERINQSLETLGFRRLPTGFNPKGPKEEREKAFKEAAKYAVTPDELDQIVDVLLANANAENPPELVNRTPIEFIEMWDSHTTSPLRRAEDPEALCRKLMRLEFIKTIRGGGEGNRAPYLEHWGARYTSDVLRKMKDSIGKTVRIVVEVDGDIRFIRAYLRRGQSEIPLGILKAAPPWHLTPHNLEQRKMIRLAQRAKKLVVEPGSDLVQTYNHLLKREAAERKASANQLAKLGKVKKIKVLSREQNAKLRIQQKDWIKII